MNKSKAKTQTAIYLVITYIGFIGCGFCIGLLLEWLDDIKGSKLSVFECVVTFLMSITIMSVAYLVHICLHECGHTLFGLITGYKFLSLRWGNLILYKSNGKLKLGIFKMGGTAGQALMLPPDGDSYNYPTFFYNVGGLIVNLVLIVISALLFPVATNPFVRIFLLSSVILGATLFLTNALPFSEMGTDGANAILFQKDSNARKFFHDTLIMNAMLADGKGLKDFPEEYLKFDWSIPLDNPLATAAAINDLCVDELNRDFDEVIRKIDIILTSASSINNLHNALVMCQKIFAMTMARKPAEEIVKFYEDHKKDMAIGATALEYQRYMYAYYTLADKNEKEASKMLENFEKLAKNYPFTGVVKEEREFISLVDEKKCS